jgi:hypothetical protein
MSCTPSSGTEIDEGANRFPRELKTASTIAREKAPAGHYLGMPEDRMKKPISVTLPHKHTKAEAKRRIRDGLDELTPKVAGFASITAGDWEADELTFAMRVMAQEVSGRLQANDDTILIEVYLPWFLHAIAEKVRGQIQKNATRILIEKK